MTDGTNLTYHEGGVATTSGASPGSCEAVQAPTSPAETESPAKTQGKMGEVLGEVSPKKHWGWILSGNDGSPYENE